MKAPNRGVVLALTVACMAGLVPRAASAQTAPRQTATVTANAPIYISIYIGTGFSPTPLRVAAPGTVLNVLQQEGSWIQVEFNDPERGTRVGWVQQSLLKFSTEALQPMDLSVREVTPVAAPPPKTSAEGLRPMDLSVREATPVAAPPPVRRSSQTAANVSPTTRWREKVWIDVNFGLASSAQSSLDTRLTRTLYYETATYDVTYHSAAGASFDVGTGGMFTETLGLGISFVGTAHMGPAQLSISIPHPTRVNANASDSKDTDTDLERVEGSANIQFMFKPKMANSKLRFRLFGGPTYFTLKADAISNIRWTQVYGFYTTANEVTITTYNTVKTETTGWGFHVGGDVSYFFTRAFGVGGFARYSLGTLTVNDDRVLADESVDVKVGGFQAGGGIRFRF